MHFTEEIIIYTPIVFCVLYLLVNYLARTPRSVCIVVLGDIGRSPRMQYHALSFAKEGFRVYIVGYKGATPLASLLSHEKVSIHHLMDPPAWLRYCPRLITYALKVIWQAVTLAWILLLLPKTSSTLIQNPPSLPSMLVVYVACRLRFSQMVIDWHNYGYTILALALSNQHPLVRVSKWYEKVLGRFADYNICVTQAMKADLMQNWNIRATTVYDRPPDIFRSVSVSEQHSLLRRLGDQYPVFASRSSGHDETAFTRCSDTGGPIKLPNRPALVVSSTSWTEDEDFGILLQALKDYDQSTCKDLPDVLCVITGKGPQKEQYRKEIETMNWKKVTFCLPWLEAEDYPLLLGSSDVGVCLHTSSSGLDLPMKVVDMFGTGLPVCAVRFNCIEELVQHQHNGLIFSTSEQLADQLKELLSGFPNAQGKLGRLRDNLKEFQRVRWHDQWKQLVLPIFVQIGGNVRVGMPSAGGLPDNFDEIGRTKRDGQEKKEN